jgi:hypothetical protein
MKIDISKITEVKRIDPNTIEGRLLAGNNLPKRVVFTRTLRGWDVDIRITVDDVTVHNTKADKGDREAFDALSKKVDEGWSAQLQVTEALRRDACKILFPDQH